MSSNDGDSALSELRDILLSSSEPVKVLGVFERTHLGRVVFLVGSTRSVLNDDALSRTLERIADLVLAARALRKALPRRIHDDTLHETLQTDFLSESVGAVPRMQIDDDRDGDEFEEADVLRGLAWLLKRLPYGITGSVVEDLAAKYVTQNE